MSDVPRTLQRVRSRRSDAVTSSVDRFPDDVRNTVRHFCSHVQQRNWLQQRQRITLKFAFDTVEHFYGRPYVRRPSNGQAIYFAAGYFLLLFLRLFSAVGDWMSTMHDVGTLCRP